MVIDFSTFYDFPRQLDRMLDEMWKPSMISQRRQSYPPVNIHEDETNIYVYSEIPGMNIDDIDLTLSDGSLQIKGKREVAKGNFYRQERPTGLFQRVINLNVPVDVDKVKARMKDGVLDVVLPKSEEAKPKKISIEAE
jgi:HSP20 family protein